MRILRTSFALLLVILVGAAGAGQAKSNKVKVTAKSYRLGASLDVLKIKAIGSVQTKTPPSILHVDLTESARVEALVLKQGGEAVGASSAIAFMDQQAKVEVMGEDGGVSLEVVASSRGSDTITLRFKITITTIEGTRRTRRSATAMARVQESKALLVIVNPRDGEPGIMTVLRAQRVK